MNFTSYSRSKLTVVILRKLTVVMVLHDKFSLGSVEGANSLAMKILAEVDEGTVEREDGSFVK